MGIKESGFKVHGQEIRFNYCPICKKEKKDNPCFSVNKDNNTYFCHTSGNGGNIEKLDEEIKNYIYEVLKEEGENKQGTPKGYNKKDFKEIMLSSKPLNEEWLNYLKGRGISKENIGIPKIARLGKYNSLMIPLTNGNTVIGIKYRTLEKKLSCEPGSDMAYFMNWQNVEDKNYLIIVEGEIDLLSAIEVGFNNVVSLPNGVSNLKCIDTHKEWLKDLKKIIIATDNDSPGREAKEKIIDKLKNKDVLYTVELGEYKDFNEVLQSENGKEKLKEIISKSKKINNKWEEFREEDGRYFQIKNDVEIKLTDFIIELKGYSNNFFIGKVLKYGDSSEFTVRKSEVYSPKGIMTNWGNYMGSSQSVPRFIDWLIERNSEKYLKEVEYYGVLDNKICFPSSNVICDRQDLTITDIEDIGELTPNEIEWLNENLIYMRSDVNQSLLGICWALGRFHINDGAYPILECNGTTSIGKTEYTEFISRLMFGSKENIKNFTSLTHHQIRSFGSCSNITPWAIDEVKITNSRLKDKALDFASIIRATYDNKTIDKGNIGAKLDKYPLRTPLIISGETEINELSIKNRMISTNLTRDNKSSDEVFFKLKETDLLEKLGKKVLTNRIKEQIKLNREEVKEVLKDVKDGRQLYNGICILTGLKTLTNILKIKDSVQRNFTSYLDYLLNNEYNVDKNFIECLKLVIGSELEYATFYRYDDKMHCARFQPLYKRIKEEINKTNATMELPDINTLRNQLKETGFIVASKKVRFKSNDFLNETESYWAVIFKDVEELKEL